jgi:hypothetical protein
VCWKTYNKPVVASQTGGGTPCNFELNAPTEKCKLGMLLVRSTVQLKYVSCQQHIEISKIIEPRQQVVSFHRCGDIHIMLHSTTLYTQCTATLRKGSSVCCNSRSAACIVVHPWQAVKAINETTYVLQPAHRNRYWVSTIVFIGTKACAEHHRWSHRQ